MSVQTAHEEVQHAIYQQKLAPSDVIDAQLSALGVQGIYDFRAVPQNKQFDYITIGDGYELTDNTLGKRSYILIFIIHIWSRQEDTQTASAMLSRINELIDQKDLTLATHAHVSTMYQQANFLLDPDGLTLHVAARYRIKTEE